MSRQSIRFVVATLPVVLVLAAPARSQSLVWSEEFDGPPIDSGSWTFDVGGSGFGNAELQFYTARPENVFIENGVLVIRALRENYEGKQFTSARLKTHGRFAFKYGTLEARIKVPDLQNGLWPAFWLLGRNIGQITWPRCGEIDVLEMGDSASIAAGTVNRKVSAAAHWDFMGSYAGYSGSTTSPVNLNGAFHIYSVSWTPTLITASLDGTPYWAIDISTIEANSLEEFHRPFFILVNLAVGGVNFVQITDPALITAPFPARLEVDWIRLYDNAHTELYFGDDSAESGAFGVFTETTPVGNSVTYGTDTELYVWNNLASVPVTPFEGSEAWSFNAGPGNWFGMGAFCLADRNMSNYSDGLLHFHMKTTTHHTIGFGIASSAAGEGWLDLVSGGEEFGLVRDGNWHEVVIPLNRFGNIDFHTIKQIFMVRGQAPAAPINFSIDNVYWTPSVARPAPQHGNYGVFTETPAHATAGQLTLGADGQFYVWENTLMPMPGSPLPYEGSASIGLTSTPGPTWFGAAFTPNVKHNLTAFRYPESLLRFAMKTTSTVTFRIGMKSGNVNEIGQKWITFANGSDPYGFVRDGQWHVVEIPMSHFSDAVDLSEVSQLFELLGTNGPITNIQIDDVAFMYGGAAIPPGGPVPGDMNCDAVVNESDVPLFVEALLDAALFDALHPGCSSSGADVNQSGSLNGLDVAGFVDTLTGQ
ncbi:MAG: hypothetical protein DCC65_07640 [Planctomycetota bacterium]|nr:MAG: hypothetical protein DCC65_07640 [Planctomycetota bacterium]